MTTTSTVPSNGKIRKSLESQLDRFDRMLDGLADAIPQVVAETIRSAAAQSVREAIESALGEVLRSRSVADAIGPSAVPLSGHLPVAMPVASVVPPTAATQHPEYATGDAAGGNRSRGWLARLRVACAARCRRLGRAVAAGWQRWLDGLSALCAPLAVLPRIVRYVEVALVVGGAVAVLAWFCGPWISSALGGLGAFGSALAVQVGLRLRGALRHPEASGSI
jgi:hypothetical protein